jgi:hypothetical protein
MAQNLLKTAPSLSTPPPFPLDIKSPGLASSAQEIQDLAETFFKGLAVFNYKKETPPLWVVFVGGTGTGKSTIFNAFCGETLSETGVERPKTFGPVVYAHKDSTLEKAFPFPSVHFERLPTRDLPAKGVAGEAGYLTVLEHERHDWAHLILADTPDLDSVEAANRQIAEDLYLLADAVAFVSSQEKYADEVPYRFLLRIMEEQKTLFFLVNKTGENIAPEDVIGVMARQGLSLKREQMWLIPYAPSRPATWLAGHPTFRAFVHAVLETLSREGAETLRKSQNSRQTSHLRRRIEHLLGLLDEETKASRQWLARLERLYRKISQELIEEERQRFAAKSREYLRTEIRRLFNRYDLLARPRRFVKDILLTPFRLLGIGKQTEGDLRTEELLKAGRRMDLTPVETAIERFNLSVLEKLPPKDENAPLFKELRQPGVALTDQEIRTRISEEQQRLAKWLEERFEKLSQEIPRGRKWGIYSTSILWGILLISFETVVGGGFSMLDAALDSALAPFVTKGVVELFAYHEIQRIARELAERYQESLLSVVREQHERYERCLQSLMTDPQTRRSLLALHSEMGR